MGLDILERHEAPAIGRPLLTPDRAHRGQVLVGHRAPRLERNPERPELGLRYPTPTPKIRRPPERTSSVASCWARTSGLRGGRMMMPVPSRIRVVCAARKASATIGS